MRYIPWEHPDAEGNTLTVRDIPSEHPDGEGNTLTVRDTPPFTFHLAAGVCSVCMAPRTAGVSRAVQLYCLCDRQTNRQTDNATYRLGPAIGWAE